LTTFVLDMSIAAAWLLPDEASPHADVLLANAQGRPLHIPSLFWHEARHVLLTAERRGRIAEGEAILGMARLRRLPWVEAEEERDDVLLTLAARHQLTTYDATYLTLALAQTLPLATADKRLAAAARAEAVPVLGPLAAS